MKLLTSIKWFIERAVWKSCYVIADAKDNSVTFSKGLFNRAGISKMEKTKVFTFYIPEFEQYAFTFNPKLEQETQMADIMYNSKYKCVGFECLIPTINKVFYDYGLPPDICVKLSVIGKKQNGMKYYLICRPNGYGTFRNQKKASGR